MSKIIMCLIVCGFFPLLLASPSDFAERADAYLSSGVPNGFSGVVLVAKEGKVLLSKGYGLANRATKEKITPQTVFSSGSVTKQFTATAICKLAQEGKLDVQDTLPQYFRDVPKDKQGITLHHLLTHGSGLVGGIGNGDFDHIPTDVYFKRLFGTELLHPPGSKYRYSNAGYSVLARVVELVSGEDYEDYVQENLFAPAGMKDTGYLHPKWEGSSLAHGYYASVNDQGTLVERFRKEGKISWVLKGNGGIQTTAEDMFRWNRALKANKVLNKAWTEKLTSPHLKENPEGSSFYGYGWAIFKTPRDTKMIAHNGSNRVYFHDNMWLPEEDVVILYFTNALTDQVENIAWKLEEMLFDPSFNPKPIRKSPHSILASFVENHRPQDSNILGKMIKGKYAQDFQNPSILNSMGYQLLEDAKTKAWSLELFKINVELFPDSGNLWDSLGDGYKKNGDPKKAIAAYQKALSLDPFIKESQNSLKELGAPVPEFKAIDIPEETLKAYVGDYVLRKDFVLAVRQDGKQLNVEPTGRGVMSMKPLSETRFFVEKARVHLVFDKKEDGSVPALTLIDGGDRILAKRK